MSNTKSGKRRASSNQHRADRVAAAGGRVRRTAKSAEAARRLTNDVIERLRKTSANPARSEFMAGCGPDVCNKEGCAEACPFGAWQRRRLQAPKIRRLLKSHPGPFFEIHIVHGNWAPPFGLLRTASIPAAKQLQRRSLDRLHNPTIVAIGTFKAAPDYSMSRWQCRIHMIVAGADRADLDTAFSGLRSDAAVVDVSVQRIKDPKATIDEIANCDLQPWQYEPKPKKAERAEFYRWLLRLPPGVRLIRYGCDRYFNELTKRGRTIKAKPRKKRPYPHWLVPHQFGVRDQDCNAKPMVDVSDIFPGLRKL